MRGGWSSAILTMPTALATLSQIRSSISRTWTPLPFLSQLGWPAARKMSTFQHPTYNIPIALPPGLSQEQLLGFHPFTSWLSTLQASLASQRANPAHPFHPDPYTLRAVTVQAYDLFGRVPHTRLGFLKLTSHVANAAGETLPASVFLRGPAVAMLVMLIPEDDGAGPGEGKKVGEEEERYVLLTVQPRIAAGSLEFVELPAGMVDEEGEFVGTAAREIQEELGMEIDKDALVCLSDLVEGGDGAGTNEPPLPKGVYPSAGGCDEYIPIYMHERRIPRAQLAEWEGKLTGLREHGEKITLKLVKMKDLWKVGARDAKALAAVALWEGLRREGRI